MRKTKARVAILKAIRTIIKQGTDPKEYRRILVSDLRDRLPDRYQKQLLTDLSAFGLCRYNDTRIVVCKEDIVRCWSMLS